MWGIFRTKSVKSGDYLGVAEGAGAFQDTETSGDGGAPAHVKRAGRA